MPIFQVRNFEPSKIVNHWVHCLNDSWKFNNQHAFRTCRDWHNYVVHIILVAQHFVQGQQYCILLMQLLSWLKSANTRLHLHQGGWKFSHENPKNFVKIPLILSKMIFSSPQMLQFQTSQVGSNQPMIVSVLVPAGLKNLSGKSNNLCEKTTFSAKW